MNRDESKTTEQHFPKDLRSLEGVFSFLEGFMTEHGVNADAAFAMTLAVEEFFTNIVKYDSHRDGLVSVGATREPDQIIVRLIDVQSDRFDVTRADAPREDTPLDQRKVGGLGIYLSHQMLDDVRYEYVNHTSTITLVKNLEQ
jgi:serine/threonine-protein kinase RsbW